MSGATGATSSLAFWRPSVEGTGSEIAFREEFVMSCNTKNRNRARQKTESLGTVDNGATKPAEEKSLQRVPGRRELALPIDQGAARAAAERLLAQATGVKDPDLAARIIDQVCRIQAVWPFSSA